MVFYCILFMTKKLPNLVPANDVSCDHILGDFSLFRSKRAQFSHLLVGLFLEVVESLFGLVFSFMQVVHNFTNFAKPFISCGLGTDSIGLLAGSEYDLFPHGIFLKINWGRRSLLFGVDDELGSDRFGTFGRSDTGVLAESVPGLLH